MKYELRDYQKEASDAAVGFFLDRTKKHNALMVLSTGAGKSVVISDIANRLDSDILVFAPSKEILEQNYEKAKSYGIECSMYSASVGHKEISRVTFCTIGSVRNYSELFKHFKYVIIDEAHILNPKKGVYKDFLKQMKCKVIGLTATPYRLESTVKIDFKTKKPKLETAKSELMMLTSYPRPFFKEIIYHIQTEELVKAGYLAKVNYYDARPKSWDERLLFKNSKGSEYSDNSINRIFRTSKFYSHLSSVILRLLYNVKTRSVRNGILVFVRRIEDAERLARKIDNCAIVSGETSLKEREEIIARFKSGEIKVIANAGVLTCLSNDTEILTKNKGWVGINNIELDDMVAQYDEGTEEISFTHPLRIIRKEFSENFVSVEGRYVNFKVTHDHNMIYRKLSTRGIGEPKRCMASELVSVSKPFIPVSGFSNPDNIEVEQEARCSNSRFLATNSYNYRKKGMDPNQALKTAKEMLEKRNSLKFKNPNELTLDECRFIGFWLGDGCVVKNKDGRRYSLSQSCCNPEMIRWVEELLNKCGIHYNKQFYIGRPDSIIRGRICKVSDHFVYNLAIGTGGHKQSVDSKLYSLLPYLRKCGSSLYWGLNRNQFFCLMEGYFKANGLHGNNNDYHGQHSIGPNKELFDLLQAIGVCRGYRILMSTQKQKDHSKKTLYKISLGDYRHHQMVNDKPTLVINYSKEQVWCVTMPKGTIVTRRKGRVAIMGNCGFDFPALDTVVMARPTMSLAMYYQIIGRCLRPHPSKKESWFIDLCGNIDRFGHVEDMRLEKDESGEWNIYSEGKKLTNVIL